MGRGNVGDSIEGGLNTSVDYGSRQYHVQTQCSERDAPVIESMVFHGGQTLVRITASYGDVAERFGFSADDGQHLLELQHADLIRKIRHGMLGDDDEAPATRPQPRAAATDQATGGPSNIDESEVRELLKQLGAAVERAKPRRNAPSRVEARSAQASRPWWRRFAIRIRL